MALGLPSDRRVDTMFQVWPLTGADTLHYNTLPRHPRCTGACLATDPDTPLQAPGYRFKWHHLRSTGACLATDPDTPLQVPGYRFKWHHLRCTGDCLATDSATPLMPPDYRFKWHHLRQLYALMMKTLLARVWQRFFIQLLCVCGRRKKINDRLSGLDTLLGVCWLVYVY